MGGRSKKEGGHSKNMGGRSKRVSGHSKSRILLARGGSHGGAFALGHWDTNGNWYFFSKQAHVAGLPQVVEAADLG